MRGEVWKVEAMVGVNFFENVESEKGRPGKIEKTEGSKLKFSLLPILGLSGVILIILLIKLSANRDKLEPFPDERHVSQVQPEISETKEVSKVLGGKRVCLEIISKIREVIPDFVWLTSISTTSDRDYSVQGIAFSMARVKEFRRNLEDICGADGDVNMSLIDNKSFEEPHVFEFSIFGRISGSQRKIPSLFEPIPKRDVPVLIEHLMVKGESFGLKLDNFPAEESSGRVRVFLKGTGSYSSVERYLDYLSNVPQTVVVSRFVVIPVSKKGIETSMVDRVEISLAVDLYVMTG